MSSFQNIIGMKDVWNKAASEQCVSPAGNMVVLELRGVETYECRNIGMSRSLYGFLNKEVSKAGIELRFRKKGVVETRVPEHYMK